MKLSRPSGALFASVAWCLCAGIWAWRCAQSVEVPGRILTLVFTVACAFISFGWMKSYLRFK